MIENHAQAGNLVDRLRSDVQPVQSDDSMAEAGRKILLADFVSMLERESGSRTGNDIEDVHQMRVSTRRMRSAFELLAPYFESKVIKPYKKDLKKTARHLGVVRDLDVMIEDLEYYRSSLSDKQQTNLQPVIDQIDSRRINAREKLVKYLNGASYKQFTEDFAIFLTTSGVGARPINNTERVTPYQVRHVLPVVIYEHLALIRAYDTVLENGSMDTLHALRIEFKRLRYIVSYFTDVLGSSSDAFVTELKIIQDHLGRMNDATVAADRLKVLIDSGEINKKQKSLLKAYIKQLKAGQKKRVEEFPSIWSGFNRRSVQTQLANALLTLR